MKCVLEIQGKREADGSRGWDVYWFQRQTSAGVFRIIEKTVSNDQKINMRCCWVSGKYVGSIFSVDINCESRRFLDAKCKNLPSAIYRPPRAVVFLAEALLAAGVLKWLWDLLVKDLVSIIRQHFGL